MLTQAGMGCYRVGCSHTPVIWTVTLEAERPVRFNLTNHYYPDALGQPSPMQEPSSLMFLS
jgi:hypothetical protein